MWSALGYVIGLLVFALPLAGIWLWRRERPHRRIRFAGWAPWWYVGGQPDVPEELQEDPDSHARRRR